MALAAASRARQKANNKQNGQYMITTTSNTTASPATTVNTEPLVSAITNSMTGASIQSKCVYESA